MRLLNFSHPLTNSQISQVENLTQLKIETVRDVRVQFDITQEFVPQVVKMVEELAISSEEWQTEAWLLVLPSLNYISTILLAELHGRIGRFPTIIRLRPGANTLVNSFEVAEIISLDGVRNAARTRR
ncbi:MAG: hypothetical protein HXX20_15400 [Chloroflexi bacterium]|nr:hypothetical protein [Chloroflexota bacterium]